jgi:cytochrome c peroxidase
MTRLSSLAPLLRAPCRRLALGVAMAGLLATIAIAQPASESEAPASMPDQEPITPIPQPPAADPQKLRLGERLFGGAGLSANNNFACSSCHDISTNGARGHTSGNTNASALDTLTVFNASLSFRLGWQGTFRSLEAHAEASLESPTSMRTNVDEAISKLDADADMVKLFRAAYGHGPDRDSLLDALVTFERSLVTPGSRFDRWLEGDASALSADELEGYRLFKSLGCSSCHQGVNVGGNLFQRQGVFRPLVPTGPKVVRVPSLRNVATTAPYFHDGSAATLEEAVRRMAAAQLDRTLTDQQIASLVTFLKTLTGNYRGRPVVGAAP